MAPFGVFPWAKRLSDGWVATFPKGSGSTCAFWDLNGKFKWLSKRGRVLIESAPDGSGWVFVGRQNMKDFNLMFNFIKQHSRLFIPTDTDGGTIEDSPLTLVARRRNYQHTHYGLCRIPRASYDLYTELPNLWRHYPYRAGYRLTWDMSAYEPIVREKILSGRIEI